MELENKKSRGHIIVGIVLILVATIICVFIVNEQKIDDVDDLALIDLTTMNGTMVYAYVNDMVNTRPDDYLGKKIKAKGQYYKSYYDVTEKYSLLNLLRRQ